MIRRTHLLREEYQRRISERGDDYRQAMEAIKLDEHDSIVFFSLAEFKDIHQSGYSKPAPQPTAKEYRHNPRKPGDLLSLLIKKITGATPSTNCKCDARRDMMNRNGWWWCWKNRHTIELWLTEEARHRGHVIDEGSAAALVRAAFKEIFSRKKITE